MKTVYRYPLAPGVTTVRTFRGAQIVDLHGRDGSASIWLLVDTDSDSEDRHFYTTGTGWSINVSDLKPIGSFSPEPGLWFHTFEVCKR